MAAFEEQSKMDLTIVSKDIDRSKIKDDKLVRMKELFPDQDNDTLARYLIARDGKVSPASELLTKALSWRRIHHPILKAEVADELMAGKAYWHGFDKQGHPLLISRPRLHNKNDVPMERTGRMAVWWLEQLISQIPPGHSKFSVLIDRTGATSNNNDLDMIKAMQGLLGYVYPERLAKVIIHPTTVVFWSFFNIAKWFLDPATREKISPCLYFYGVQEFVADEYIPVTLGGKCTYEYNPDDYKDPYPEELVLKTMEEREALYGTGVISCPTSIFEQPTAVTAPETAQTADSPAAKVQEDNGKET